MNKINLSFDTETLGIRNSALIFAIGAVCLEHDEKFAANVNPFTLFDDSLRSKIDEFSIDHETIEWHKKKNTANWYEYADYYNCFEHSEMVHKFAAWIAYLKSKYNAEVRMWCQGTDFDISKLYHHFHVYNIQCPWKYDQVRDLRTARSLFGIKDKLKTASAHTAIGDAMFQADIIKRILECSAMFLGIENNDNGITDYGSGNSGSDTGKPEGNGESQGNAEFNSITKTRAIEGIYTPVSSVYKDSN